MEGMGLGIVKQALEVKCTDGSDRSTLKNFSTNLAFTTIGILFKTHLP